jgi:phosphoribosylaminoimidazolecarboxamide formyltransferase/IMP cyclohydrolase
VQDLRYGENPQQSASWYRLRGATGGLHEVKILQGKTLSYNNLLDLHAAFSLVTQFHNPAVVAVKHNNPCGVATGLTIEDATEKCLKADPVSVFGGIVALNRTLDEVSAEKLSAIFLECIIAPEVTEGALNFLAKKKNLRVLEWAEMLNHKENIELKTIAGGYLVQQTDHCENWDSSWKIIGENPSVEIQSDLLFAWKVCASLKSNAIAIAAKGTTLGLGMGQVNRVEAVGHAIERMAKHHSEIKNAVLASDAFFPFPDSIELIAKAGIRWIIQPGGSVNDEAVVEEAKKQNISMVITGKRHFRH